MFPLLFQETVERNLRLGKYVNTSPFNSRYRSWNYCREAYISQRHVATKDIDLLCLNLAFYLASWGMYRGSTALLFNDYKVHRVAVCEIYKSTYNSLWNYDPFIQGVTCLPKWLLGNSGGLRDVYNNIVQSTNYPAKHTNKNSSATDTLITKVMLGTWGCIPAYDEYFKAGLRYFGFSDSLTLNALHDIIYSLSQFQEVHNTIKIYACAYTPMKIIDAYFWEIGYITSFIARLKKINIKVSQSRVVYVVNEFGVLNYRSLQNEDLIKELENLLPCKNVFKVGGAL